MTALGAVLFDYSGTLFRLEEDESWFTDLRVGEDQEVDGHLQAELMRRMTTPVGAVVELDEAGHHAWNNRDLDPAMHRAAYLAVLKASGVTRREHAEALYDRVTDPMSWTPYPDTSAVLKGLSELGIPTVIVSNIAFDVRPAFEKLGIDQYVSEYVLSYEVGAIKPNAEIFDIALQRAGVSGDRALMVGDSDEADGGARAVGAAFALVEPLPTGERPDSLLSAVRAHGIDL